MFKIKFPIDDQYHELCWKNSIRHRYFSYIQSAKYFLPSFHMLTEEMFEMLLVRSLHLRLGNLKPYFDKIPTNSNVISVGSGCSTFEMLLSKHYGWNFYLIDKSELSLKGNYYSETSDGHGFYNSWDVVRDGIESSNLDTSKFLFLDPSDTWPQDISLIYSSRSYGFHYSVDVYWEQVKNSLQRNGYLILDILMTNYKTASADYTKVIDKISNHMNCKPVMFDYGATEQYRLKWNEWLSQESHENRIGYTCVWQNLN